MDFGCGCENGDGEIKRGGCAGGKDELCDGGEEGGGGCTNLEDEFAKTSDVDLCDVEKFLVCLFENVTNSWVVGYELEWDGKEG